MRTRPSQGAWQIPAMEPNRLDAPTGRTYIGQMPIPIRPFLADDTSPAPVVPEDLDRPAGAEVAADGTVACVSCRKRLAVGDADIVGKGYRCVPCGQQAQIRELQGGRSDIRAHLSERDRLRLYREGQRSLWGGVAMSIAGVIAIPFVEYLHPKFIGALIIGGIAIASWGYSRVRASR